MGILNKQVGWSTESNLLWDILKKLNTLKTVIASSANNALQVALSALSAANTAQTTANTALSTATSTQTAFQTTQKVQSLGSISGATAINLSNGNIVLATLTAPTSFSFTSLPAVGFETAFSLRLSGIFAITFPVGTRFPAGTPPVPAGVLYEIPCSIDSSGNLIVYGVINDIKTP
jgi:hypothetical protein